MHVCGYSVCTIIHCLDFKTTPPPDMSNGFWNMSSVRFLDGNFSRCFTVDVWWTWSKHPQKKVLVNRLPSSNQQLASQWAKRVLEKYSEIPKKKTRAETNYRNALEGYVLVCEGSLVYYSSTNQKRLRHSFWWLVQTIQRNSWWEVRRSGFKSRESNGFPYCWGWFQNATLTLTAENRTPRDWRKSSSGSSRRQRIPLASPLKTWCLETPKEENVLLRFVVGLGFPGWIPKDAFVVYGGKTDCGFDHVAFMRTPFKKLHVLQMEMPKNKKNGKSGRVCVQAKKRFPKSQGIRRVLGKCQKRQWYRIKDGWI